MKYPLPKLSKLLIIGLVATAMAATGCKKDKTSAETTTGSEQTTDPNAERNVDLTPQNGDGGAEACSLQTVFFGFDSDELTPDSRVAIQNAVECFRNKGAAVRMRLTGATDPRGTEEYNIALGERRAQTVRSYLVSLGVDAGRLGVTSVGEEMASGTDEGSWAQDRNVSTDTGN